ncbi:LuxR C-terminal-related transcriptional regulator [Streptomyces koyangensis]
MDHVTLPLAQETAGGVAGWATGLVETMGAPGAGLAIALENLFPPLPSEVILSLTGFAAGQGVISLAAALFRTTLGSVAGAAIDPEIVRRLVVRTTRTDPPARLTPRESSVLKALAEGLTNAAIARRLHLSVSSVEKSLQSVFDKLELEQTTGYSRRVLAVLRHLES